MTDDKISFDLIAKRFPTQEPARIEVYGRKGSLFCRMSNLSSTGAFFEIVNSPTMPRVGDLIQVTISLKQLGKSHVLNGEVIWSKGSGLGMSFIKQKELLQKLSK